MLVDRRVCMGRDRLLMRREQIWTPAGNQAFGKSKNKTAAGLEKAICGGSCFFDCHPEVRHVDFLAIPLNCGRELGPTRSMFHSSLLGNMETASVAISSWLASLGFASLRKYQQRTCSGTSQSDLPYQRISVCRCKMGGKHCKCRRGALCECCEFGRYFRNHRLLESQRSLDEYRLSWHFNNFARK